MQTAIKTTIDQETQYEKVLSEKKWLAWLIKIWDKEGKMPSWVTLKRAWPNEYQQILCEFGVWATVEGKLKKAYEIHKKSERNINLYGWQQIDPNMANRHYSLEDYLLGTIKIQKYLGINRLPTYIEMKKYAKALSLPRATSYQNRFTNKNVWALCLDRYLAASPEERPQVLRELERDLEARMVLKDGYKKVGRKASYSGADCLEGLLRIQQYLQLRVDELPSGSQIDQCATLLKTPRKQTMQKILGYKKDWVPLLIAYKEQKEIEEFLATYHELEVTKTVNLNSLYERILQEATTEEKLRLKNLTARMQKATRKQPVECQICLDGKEYEIIIRPKG